MLEQMLSGNTFFLGTRDQTRGLQLTSQLLYHLATLSVKLSTEGHRVWSWETDLPLPVRHQQDSVTDA